MTTDANPTLPSVPATSGLPSGVSERWNSLPSALRSEADFLNRRFAAFAADLTLAATELEDLRSEVAYLRAGILRAIENEAHRAEILQVLHTSPVHTSAEKSIG